MDRKEPQRNGLESKPNRSFIQEGKDGIPKKEIDEESIDFNITLTQASSLYVIMEIYLRNAKAHLKDLLLAQVDFPKDEKLTEQIEIQKLILSDAEFFHKEARDVIHELS